MEYKYIPKGVCSTEMIFDIDEKEMIINNLTVVGGCNGNLKGIAALIKGMKVDDAIYKLKNIKCGMRSTSCPDQIATALMEFQNK